MKKRMKMVLCILLLIAESLTGFSQSIELRGGQSIFPANYVSLRYNHYTNSEVNISGGVFTESSRKNRLHYNVYGADLLGQYASSCDGDDSKFSYRAGLGATCQLESEPWVYKDMNTGQKINYGLLGELAGEWNMTNVFSLSVFVQQKYLFNKDLGTKHFVFGLGLAYHFDNN